MPEPPNVLLSTKDLCIIDNYAGNSAILMYHIVCTDETGYVSIFTILKSGQNNTCTTLFTNSSCSPVNISVQSLNSVGFSDPVLFMTDRKLQSS